MKIGIDIDEVLAKFVDSYLQIYNFKYNKNINTKDMFTYDLWVPLKISRDEAVSITNELFNSDLYDKIGVIEGSQEGVRRLAKDNELYIITARPIFAKEKTKEFFNKYYQDIKFSMYYTGDFFNGAMIKSELCSKKGIDYMIEDNAEIVLDCSKKGINTILFDKPWNQGLNENQYTNINSSCN